MFLHHQETTSNQTTSNQLVLKSQIMLHVAMHANPMTSQGNANLVSMDLTKHIQHTPMTVSLNQSFITVSRQIPQQPLQDLDGQQSQARRDDAVQRVRSPLTSVIYGSCPMQHLHLQAPLFCILPSFPVTVPHHSIQHLHYQHHDSKLLMRHRLDMRRCTYARLKQSCTVLLRDTPASMFAQVATTDRK